MIGKKILKRALKFILTKEIEAMTSNSVESPSASSALAQEQSLEISNLAHAKILLHAIQYSTGSIHGILIGQFHHASSSTNNNAGPLLRIEDSIPICHSAPTKPTLDMAFHLVQSYIDQNKKDEATSGNVTPLQIVGW